MTIGPVDRRGLQEIVAFSVAATLSAGVLIASIIKTGVVDHYLMINFGTMVTTLIVRGSKSASDRSALSDRGESR